MLSSVSFSRAVVCTGNRGVGKHIIPRSRNSSRDEARSTNQKAWIQTWSNQKDSSSTPVNLRFMEKRLVEGIRARFPGIKLITPKTGPLYRDLVKVLPPDESVAGELDRNFGSFATRNVRLPPSITGLQASTMLQRSIQKSVQCQHLYHLRSTRELGYLQVTAHQQDLDNILAVINEKVHDTEVTLDMNKADFLRYTSEAMPRLRGIRTTFDTVDNGRRIRLKGPRFAVDFTVGCIDKRSKFADAPSSATETDLPTTLIQFLSGNRELQDLDLAMVEFPDTRTVKISANTEEDLETAQLRVSTVREGIHTKTLELDPARTVAVSKRVEELARLFIKLYPCKVHSGGDDGGGVLEITTPIKEGPMVGRLFSAIRKSAVVELDNPALSHYLKTGVLDDLTSNFPGIIDCDQDTIVVFGSNQQQVLEVCDKIRGLVDRMCYRESVELPGEDYTRMLLNRSYSHILSPADPEVFVWLNKSILDCPTITILSSDSSKLSSTLALLNSTIEKLESRVFSVPWWYDMLQVGNIHQQFDSFKKQNKVSSLSLRFLKSTISPDLLSWQVYGDRDHVTSYIALLDEKLAEVEEMFPHRAEIVTHDYTAWHRALVLSRRIDDEEGGGVRCLYHNKTRVPGAVVVLGANEEKVREAERQLNQVISDSPASDGELIGKVKNLSVEQHKAFQQMGHKFTFPNISKTEVKREEDGELVVVLTSNCEETLLLAEEELRWELGGSPVTRTISPRHRAAFQRDKSLKHELLELLKDTPVRVNFEGSQVTFVGNHLAVENAMKKWNWHLPQKGPLFLPQDNAVSRNVTFDGHLAFALFASNLTKIKSNHRDVTFAMQKSHQGKRLVRFTSDSEDKIERVLRDAARTNLHSRSLTIDKGKLQLMWEICAQRTQFLTVQDEEVALYLDRQDLHVIGHEENSVSSAEEQLQSILSKHVQAVELPNIEEKFARRLVYPLVQKEEESVSVLKCQSKGTATLYVLGDEEASVTSHAEHLVELLSRTFKSYTVTVSDKLSNARVGKIMKDMVQLFPKLTPSYRREGEQVHFSLYSYRDPEHVLTLEYSPPHMLDTPTIANIDAYFTDPVNFAAGRATGKLDEIRIRKEL